MAVRTMKTTNVALVGVGGQGTLLASEVLARAAMLAGMDVKKSEVHGMAQRGGSVVSQVRFGDHVYSAIIPQGETDYLVSFELTESLRHADMLAPDGMALINEQTIVPITVSSGQQTWPSDMDERIERAFPRRLLIDALTVARELGNIRVVNMVLTGALSTVLDIPEDTWLQAIKELAPPKHLDVNLRAFAAGRQTA